MANDINLKIGATDATGTAFRSAEQKMKGFAGSAKSMLGALGVGLSVGAITGAVKQAIDFGSSLNDAAISTQTSVEGLQVFRFAATQAGASAEKMDKALIKLNDSAEAAKDGTGAEADALRRLGISTQAFAAMNADQRMIALANAVSKAKDQNMAMSAVMDLMGSKNAPFLMQMLQQLAKDGFDNLKKSAEDAGQLMSTDTMKRLDDAGDSIDQLKNAMTIKTGETVAFWMDAFDGIENDTLSVRLLREELEKIDTVMRTINPVWDMIRNRMDNNKMLAAAEKNPLTFPVGANPYAPVPGIPQVGQAASAGTVSYKNAQGETVTQQIMSASEEQRQSEQRLADEIKRSTELNLATVKVVAVTNAEIEKLQSQIKTNRQ